MRFMTEEKMPSELESAVFQVCVFSP